MSKRILFADDDDQIRRLAALSLSRVGGYDVAAVGGGVDVLQRLESYRPDAVVLDVRMPGLSGVETVRRIRHSRQSWQDIPVVFLTASLRSTQLAPLQELGAHGVLVKPFDPVLLPGQLADLLGWS